MRGTYLENGALALACAIFGVMAGFFWAYSVNVSPALAQVSGETWALVQSLLNHHIRRFTFGAFFFGGALVSVLAVLLNLRHRRDAAFWLLAVAVLVYVGGVIVVTRQVSVPLNDYIDSWDPANLPVDWAEVRADWIRANGVRLASSLASFALCLAALVRRASRERRMFS